MDHNLFLQFQSVVEYLINRQFLRRPASLKLIDILEKNNV